MKWDWKNVERDGLPEPDGDKMYLVEHLSGCGYGTYNYAHDWNPDIKDFEKSKRTRWFLDFDGCGYEEYITNYIEIHWSDDE